MGSTVTKAIGSRAEIWVNQSGNNNHWLDVALVRVKEAQYVFGRGQVVPSPKL